MPKRTHDGLRKRCAHSRKYWSECACPWWFGFHHGGREYRYSLTRLAEKRNEAAPKTKDDAVAWRDRLRAEIRDGTFADPDAPAAAPTTAHLTFGDLCDRYLENHVRTPGRRVRGRYEMEMLVRMMRRAEVSGPQGATMRLEDKPLDAITKADVEAVRVWRRQQQTAGRARKGEKAGEVGINRLLSRMRHVFTWAVVEGYSDTTPFRRGPVAVVKLNARAEGARTRRLAPGEEANLLKHAGPHLRAVIVAALSTGCRIGELLSLQWQQIRYDEQGNARWLVLPSEKTKTAEARVLPIGPRLRSELSMRRHAVDGKVHPPTAYVFGDDTGGRIKSVQRAWQTCVLKAHGITPTWEKRPHEGTDSRGHRRQGGRFSAECREALDRINLRIHDLRREFACSLLESSADLHDVRDFLGHANITTTSRYLSTSPVRLARALDRMESGVIRTPFAQNDNTDGEATVGESTQVVDLKPS